MNNGINQGGLTAGDTYYLVIRNQTGQYFYATETAFEDLNVSHWTAYAISAAEANAAGGYFGTIPAIAAGIYDLELRLQSGADPNDADPVAAVDTIYWNGTGFIIPGGGSVVVDVSPPAEVTVEPSASQVPVIVDISSVQVDVVTPKTETPVIVGVSPIEVIITPNPS